MVIVLGSTQATHTLSLATRGMEERLPCEHLVLGNVLPPKRGFLQITFAGN